MNTVKINKFLHLEMCGCGYQKIELGTFCISKDLDYLRTGDECKIAAETLDIPYGGHFAGDDNPSCVYHKDLKKIYFNRNGRARCLKNRCRSKMDSNHAAICKGTLNSSVHFFNTT